jgi:hypothetical protein
MNNCKSTDFKYLSSKANAEKRLFDKGAIDVYNKIINLEIFNDLALQFLEFVKKEFNLDPTSVISGRFGDSVIFNNDVFRKVDKVRGYDKINAENIRKQLAELDKPTQQIKPGVEELFESNPELANQVYEALRFKEYSKETKSKLALTERLKDLFKDKSTVLFRAGDNTDAFYIDLVKTSDDRYFYFSEGQSPEEISKERFAEEIEFIDGQIATTKEKDAFIKNFLDIADLNQISENPLLTKEEKIEAQKDILKKVTPQQKQQALQLYSQYLESLSKSNTNPVLQGNQQEQVKKFAELQERLSNKEFIEGAKGAWESTPALQQYGTQEEYNDYIARVSLGIIKNPSSGEYNYTSQVKDITYHIGYAKDKFDKQFIGTGEGTLALGKGFYFGNDIFAIAQQVGFEEFAYESQGDLKELSNILGNKLKTVILNIKKPYYEKGDLRWGYVGGEELKIRELTKNNDGIISDGEYVVFEPEQIHILGNKQDIEGFKEFVGKGEVEKKPRINYEKFINLKPSSKITKEEWKELTQEEQEVLMFQAENC